MTAVVTGAVGAVITLAVVAGAASRAGAGDSRDAGGAGDGAADAREKEARRLSGLYVGRWRPESGPGGKAHTVRADGTARTLTTAGPLAL